MWIFTLLLNLAVSYVNEGCWQCCARDCQYFKDIGFTESGEYHIIPDGTQNGIDVFCDMHTDGGGWLVFQRRNDGSVQFNRSWEEYQMGFGNLSGEHWLGNIALYTILLRGHYELRIELETRNDSLVTKYISFKLENPAEMYKLSLASYSGQTESCIVSSNGKPFSTNDNKTENYIGGWWDNDCSYASLNAHYRMNGTTKIGIRWVTLSNETYFLTKTEMKVRKLFG